MTSVETLTVALLCTLAAQSERVTHVGPRRTRLAPGTDFRLDACLDVVTSCVHGLDADLDVGLICDAGGLLGGSGERVLAGLSAEWDFGHCHASIVVDGAEPCQYLLTSTRQRIHRRRDPVQAVKGGGEDGDLFDPLDGGAA